MKTQFKAFIIFGIIFQLIILSLHAQESTLLLRNGKTVLIQTYQADSANYYEGFISFIKADGHKNSMHLDDVFSVTESNGEEVIFYEPNNEFGEILSPEQMKQYTIGYGDSRQHKVSPLVFIGGVLAGVGGALVPNTEIKMANSTVDLPVGVLVPVTYVGLLGTINPGKEELAKQLPDKANNDYYLMGYKNGIEKKRLRQGLIGSGLGFLAGFIVLSSMN